VTGWELLIVAVAVAAALAHTDPDGEVTGQIPPRLCVRTEEPTTRASEIFAEE
jgi:hypothetical protein